MKDIMQPQTVIKANYLIFRDYWFTNAGILQIEIIPRKLFFAIVAALLILDVFFGAFLLFIPALLFLLLSYLLAARIRSRPIATETESKLGSVSARIDWEDVTGIEIRGRMIRIQAPASQYKAKIPAAEVGPLKDFLRLRIADKVDID